MTSRVHLAIYDTMADWEVGHAVANINTPIWHDGDHQVVTVAETSEAVTTMGGFRIQPDLKLQDLRAEESEMSILPGASTWDTGGNGMFAEAARDFLAHGVPVAAICGATFGLAKAGLLNDRVHTSSALSYLEQAPGYAGREHYREERAVTDNNLITAGPADPVPFARHVFARLGLFTPPVLKAWSGLYGTGDARYFGDLMAARQRATAQ
jgi:putative intracellular protease/amidase